MSYLMRSLVLELALPQVPPLAPSEARKPQR